jgi:hypothetical protein
MWGPLDHRAPYGGRRMRIAEYGTRGALAVAAITAVAVMGCGTRQRNGIPHDRRAAATRAGWPAYNSRKWGYDVAIPRGWHRAKWSLTPHITDPVEILTVATFQLPVGEELCCIGGALARVRPAGALVTIQERGRGARGGPDFPPRPARFGPDPKLPGRSEWPSCAATPRNRRRWRPLRPVPMLDYYFGFGDAGRAFHVLVAIGRAAPGSVRREAFRILDSLHFDPHVRPRWRSSG